MIFNIRTYKLLFLGIFFISLRATEVLEVKIFNTYQINKSFAGKILPSEFSELGFETSGKIKKLYVDIGENVKSGDILASLSNDEAKAMYDQAFARYELLSTNYTRSIDLRKDGHISEFDLDKARSDFLISKSEYDLYKTRLNQKNLIAPFDGIIQKRYADTGSVVGAGQKIFDIVKNSSVEAHIAIPDELILDLSKEEDFEFVINGRTINGTFSRVAPMSENGSRSRLAIFNFNEYFNPGSVVKIKLKINKYQKGTWIPLKSLSQTEQGLWSVYTVENNIVVRDLVEIIYYEGDYAYVSGTIKDGDLLIVGGAIKSIEGNKLESK